MPTLTTQILTTIDEIRSFAEQWDDLWYRSAIAAPTFRAALLALHLEHFHPNSRIWCPVVLDEAGKPLAALPMIDHRKAMIHCGGLPTNEWSGSGDLLLDESADVTSVCDTLVSALRHAPWPLCWFEWMEFQSSRWQALIEAVQRQGGQAETKLAFEVGMIDTTGDWESYHASWSKNHRRNMKRYVKQIAELGDESCQIQADITSTNVEQPLREAFEVEDRNWKGEQGSSILQSEGMWDFYLKQAQQLAEWNQFRLTCLRINGMPIAMEYGYAAKGVHHACKVGYDSEYQKQSPGNVLQMRSLEQAFADSATNLVDYMGPIGQSCDNWRPEKYAIGSVMLAPASLFGKAMLGAYRHVWPTVRRLRGRGETV